MGARVFRRLEVFGYSGWTRGSVQRLAQFLTPRLLLTVVSNVRFGSYYRQQL